jgi:hypothetical protein
MKKLSLVLFFAIGISAFSIYGQTNNDDMLKLLKLAGVDEIMDQVIDELIQELNRLVPGIPDVFWVKNKEKFNADDYINACVPVYSKYYSQNEIKQLITLIESPLNESILIESPLWKKVLEVSPLIGEELESVAIKWAEKWAEDIKNELVKNGYIED